MIDIFSFCPLEVCLAKAIWIKVFLKIFAKSKNETKLVTYTPFLGPKLMISLGNISDTITAISAFILLWSSFSLVLHSSLHVLVRFDSQTIVPQFLPVASL